MSDDVGKNIMTLAKVLAWIVGIAAIIACLAAPALLLVWIIGGVVAVIMCWPLYGFGMLIDDVHNIRTKGVAGGATKSLFGATQARPVSAHGSAQTSVANTVGWICPTCKTENSANAKFCQGCGELKLVVQSKPGHYSASAPQNAQPKEKLETPVQPEITDDPSRIRCPNCGCIQRSDRKLCFECGTAFIRGE